MTKLHRLRRRRLFFAAALLAAVTAAAVLTGRYPTPGIMKPWALAEDPMALSLILHLRLPRVLVGLILGVSLAAAGDVFQMIFSNPLVEPGFLGVSQGAAFGASLSIVTIGSSLWAVQASAALFALIGLGASYFFARNFHFGGWVLRLILAGIAVSALFSSGVGILKFAADPMSQLPEITFWMLGGLWSVTWSQALSILPVFVTGTLLLFLLRWRLNLLSMDDRTAFSLGMAPFRERLLLLFSATAITAAAISVSGIVGWVGLIIPHIARRLFSSDSRYSLPASMVLGGIFVVICDTAARTALDGEIPLGVLTSLLGASLFIVLLSKRFIKGGAHG
ncbi:MAG: FecCD family ABC transporter permease [Spirochaetaceae bacterium]